MNRIHDLTDDEKCCETIRRKRWPHAIHCPRCASGKIVKRGKNHRHSACRRCTCRNCRKRFDDLTGTIFAGRRLPLRVWIAYLCLTGLNVSNRQTALDSGLSESDGQAMADLLRQGIFKRRRPVRLKGEAEFDEVCIVTGHKGRPGKIAGRKARRNRLRGARGRSTPEKGKPPISGMIERGGDVVIRMPGDVKQAAVKPLTPDTAEAGTQVYAGECVIYSQLETWGCKHKTVSRGAGEYARDEDGDGFHEVHVNTMEGFWSLLRSRLRPHRGVSQEKMPIYPGFFEFVHNSKRRGKALLGSLLNLLLRPEPCPQNQI